MFLYKNLKSIGRANCKTFFKSNYLHKLFSSFLFNKNFTEMDKFYGLQNFVNFSYNSKNFTQVTLKKLSKNFKEYFFSIEQFFMDWKKNFLNLAEELKCYIFLSYKNFPFHRSLCLVLIQKLNSNYSRKWHKKNCKIFRVDKNKYLSFHANEFFLTSARIYVILVWRRSATWDFPFAKGYDRPSRYWNPIEIHEPCQSNFFETVNSIHPILRAILSR